MQKERATGSNQLPVLLYVVNARETDIYRSAEILSSNIRSAGSHLTEPRLSFVSQAESACSLRCRDSDFSEHTKQCMVRWKAG